eukprot:1681398-Rhodomonas_salina.1
MTNNSTSQAQALVNSKSPGIKHWYYMLCKLHPTTPKVRMQLDKFYKELVTYENGTADDTSITAEQVLKVLNLAEEIEEEVHEKMHKIFMMAFQQKGCTKVVDRCYLLQQHAQMGFDQSSAFLAEVDKAAKEIAAEEAAEKKKQSPCTGLFCQKPQRLSPPRAAGQWWRQAHLW